MKRALRFGLAVTAVLVLVALLATTVLAAPPPWTPAAGKKEFKDIRKHWAEPIIRRLQQQNIISGYEDGTFRPSNTVKRVEALVLIVKALAQKGVIDLDDYESLPDVYVKHLKQAEWAEKYIAAALDYGIVTAGEIADLRFLQAAKRYEVAVWLARALGEETDQDDAEEILEDFADSDSIPVRARNALGHLVRAGIMRGTPGNELLPLKPVTRAEMAALIAKFLEGVDGEIPGDKPEVETAFWGTVWEVDGEGKRVRVLTATGPRWFEIDTEEIYLWKNGRRSKGDFADILPDSLIYLELDEDDGVAYIQVYPDRKATYSGRIVALNVGLVPVPYQQPYYVTIETADEVEMTFALRSATRYEGPGIEEQRHLRQGMEIEIAADGGIATRVRVLERVVEGEITALGNEEIELNETNTFTLVLPDTAAIELNGEPVGWADLETGFYAELVVSGRWVLSIKAWEPLVGNIVDYLRQRNRVELRLRIEKREIWMPVAEEVLVFLDGQQEDLDALFTLLDENEAVAATIYRRGDNVAVRISATTS